MERLNTSQANELHTQVEFIKQRKSMLISFFYFLCTFISYLCVIKQRILKEVDKPMNRIKEVLEEKGIKQTWLVEKLGKSFSIVNSYVCNRRQPSLETLFQIVEILGGKNKRPYRIMIRDNKITLSTRT